MDAIRLMMDEHENIRRVLRAIRKLCINILNGKDVDSTLLHNIIDFVRNYADKHHHNKEEEVLFKKMSDELGEAIAKGPIYGMLAEHDLGRLFMKNLEQAIARVNDGDKDSRVDIIANLIAYADLLERHIEKENTAIYKFAESRLSESAKQEVEEKCKDIESDAREKDVQDKYLKFIDKLEEIVE